MAIGDKATTSFKPRPILFGFAERRRSPNGKPVIRPVWSRVSALLALLFVIFWMGKTIGLYYFFKHLRNFDEVKMVDMFLFPANRAAHQTKMGDYFVEQAKDALKEGDAQTAYHLCHHGVVRSPANLEGRMILSRFKLLPAIDRPDAAFQLLEKGLDYGGGKDVDYLRYYCQMLLVHHEDQQVMAIAERLLPEITDADEDAKTLRRVLSFSAAKANFYRGNFDAAEDLINDYMLTGTVEGIDLAVQIAWDRGQHKLALEKLEAAMEKYPKEDRLFALIGKYYREEGDFSKVLNISVRRMMNNPLSFFPRLEILRAYEKLGETEKVERNIERFIRDFSDESAAMQGLCNFATDRGDVDLARRLYLMALEKNFEIPVFALLFIEASVVADNNLGAIEFADELARESPEWLGGDRLLIFNSLRSVAYYGQGNSELGDLYLNKFLAAKKVRVPTLMAVSKRYQAQGNLAQARRVLVQAYEQDPKNQSALAGIIEIDLDTGNSQDLSIFLRKLLQTRRPSYSLLGRAFKQLGSDRFIFAQDRENLLLELADVLRENKAS